MGLQFFKGRNMDKLSTDLSTQVNLSDIGAMRKELKAKLEIIEELITGYEERASSGLLTEEEAIHLDFCLESEQKIKLELSDFDTKIAESLAYLETAKADNDIFTRGKRSFHDIESEKGQAQLESKVNTQREIRIRRTREEIIDYYKAKIKLIRPNLKNIYTVNSLLRTLGISKTIENTKHFEREYLKQIVLLKDKYYESL